MAVFMLVGMTPCWSIVFSRVLSMLIAVYPPYLYNSAFIPSGPGACLEAMLFTSALISFLDRRMLGSAVSVSVGGPSYILLQKAWKRWTVDRMRCGAGLVLYLEILRSWFICCIAEEALLMTASTFLCSLDFVSLSFFSCAVLFLCWFLFVLVSIHSGSFSFCSYLIFQWSALAAVISSRISFGWCLYGGACPIAVSAARQNACVYLSYMISMSVNVRRLSLSYSCTRSSW